MKSHITDGVVMRPTTAGLISDAVLGQGKKMHSLLNRQRPHTLLLSGCVLLFGALTAWAQEAEKLTAKIQEVQPDRQWIHIPVNRSVLIETNLPAVRQQTLSPEIADVASISPKQVMVIGKSIGRTQVIIWAADGQQQIFDIAVELELDLLNEAIKKVDPRATVQAVPVLETVMLTGTVSDAATADRIMEVAAIFAPSVQNHLQVAGEQQVMLKCTVAEMSRTAMRQLGVNGYLWGNNFADFPIVSNIGGINTSTFGRVAGPIGADLTYAAPATQSGNNATLSFALPSVQTQIFIQALKENGLAKILAEPTLVTLSGRTAAFLAGGEFPVPIPQQSSGGGVSQTITIEFKEFGVRLAFTPVVLANQMIRLNVAPEVSELDFAQGVQFAGFVVPGLNSRRAETTVEIGSGQTLAIAGLLSENVRSSVSRVPGLGEVPVLGALFRSTEYQRNITELVILVTPELVSPMNPDQVPPLPGDSHRDPNDWQFFGLGMDDGYDHQTIQDEESDDDDDELDDSIARLQVDPQAQAVILGPWGVSDMEETTE
ncbi:MAG: hypothetical protein HJJLKODD_00262 [Phycisphaerae bacterium]|nr:hypothetical protein [Phycisphaerae bacterium]